MANRKTSKTFLQPQRNNFIDHHTPESHRRECGPSCQARALAIKTAEMVHRAVLIESAERLCASQKAICDAVLKRLGFSNQHDTLPSPQPPASRKRSPKSSMRGRKIRLPPIERNSSQLTSTNETLDEHASQEALHDSVLERLQLNEEDPFFEEKLRLGSKGGVLACQLAKTETRRPNSVTSICSVDRVSPVDAHTLSELTAIPKIRSPVSSPFTPTPPPTAAPLTRRASRLPVLSANLGGECKEVADGCKLRSCKGKVEELVKQFQLLNLPSPQPPAAPRKTAARTPVVPAPPPKAAPPKRGEPRRGTILRPQKADRRACQDEVQPLAMPAESLSMCFTQLESDDWMEKTKGFKSIQALVRHHPQLLQTKLHEVCLALIKEVNNLRSSVACAAMECIAQLHVHLGKAMDPEAEGTGRTLLLKLAQTTNDFIHQHVNHALDVLVEGCSPGRVISTLLNTGLSHRCAAVRGSTAQHLHQLAEVVGENHILTRGKIFSERFLSAVCKMSLDAAPDVRHYGHKMLQGLVLQREFTGLWNKIIPVKDRHPLEKIIKKMVQ